MSTLPSLSRRSLLVGAAGAMGLAAAGAAGVAGPGADGLGADADAQSADPFDDLRRQLRTFRTLVVDLEYARRPLTLVATSSGRVALELFPFGWWLWRGGELLNVNETTGGDACPRVDRWPVPPQLGELWAELRSGLAGSRVTATTPGDLPQPKGFWQPPEIVVRMIELPFSWAANLRWFVAVGPGGRLKETLLLRPDGANLATRPPFGSPVSHARVLGIRWNVPVPTGVFSTAYPDIAPPGQRQSIRGDWHGRPNRDYERCEVEGGHHHGDDLEREHTLEEIEGCGTPARTHGAWSPACEPPDPTNPCGGGRGRN